jgi:hypothetical protein
MRSQREDEKWEEDDNKKMRGQWEDKKSERR